ncbi:hypothetical protein ISCGN_003414 [Ixodes scapularis]
MLHSPLALLWLEMPFELQKNICCSLMDTLWQLHQSSRSPSACCLPATFHSTFATLKKSHLRSRSSGGHFSASILAVAARPRKGERHYSCVRHCSESHLAVSFHDASTACVSHPRCSCSSRTITEKSPCEHALRRKRDFRAGR